MFKFIHTVPEKTYRFSDLVRREGIEPPAGRDSDYSNGNDPGYHYPIGAYAGIP